MMKTFSTNKNESKRFEARLSAEDARIVIARMAGSGFTKQSDYVRSCIMSGNFHHQEHFSELIGTIGIETGKLRCVIEQDLDDLLRFKIEDMIRDLTRLMAKAVETLHFG